jgi:hypothetical protein
MENVKEEPYGTFPTPYGVSVPVSRRTDVPEGDDTEFLFSMDATMTMAGIHDPAIRKRCRDRANADPAHLFDAVTEFGGRPVPRVPLSPASRDASTYQQLPAEYDIQRITDHWITRVADQHRWCDRAPILQEMLTGHLDQRDRMPDRFVALPLSIILTAILENLGEQEIDCLEAAAFYAHSAHSDWRAASTEWLTPIRATWWADWIKQRQGYRRFAALARHIYSDQPVWLSGRRL